MEDEYNVSQFGVQEDDRCGGNSIRESMITLVKQDLKERVQVVSGSIRE